MAKYNTCDNCGANLDPGERCDCEPEGMKPAGFEILTAKKELIKQSTPRIFAGGEKPRYVVQVFELDFGGGNHENT